MYNNKQLMQLQTRSFIKPKHYEKYKEIINYNNKCTVCLSYQTQIQNKGSKDQLITCDLCMGSIHQQHYGSELLNYAPINSKWLCQRCSYLINNKDQNKPLVQCQFCPSKKGIMKLIECDKKKVWSHLQCIIWDFPIRTFTCYKFQSVKKLGKSASPSENFWFRQFNQKKCKLCQSARGDFIKCKYFSCSAFYHVTCARKIGVVRQLQKMRIQKSNVYIPVYCVEHLEKRGKDFRKKLNAFSDKDKQKRLIQLAQIYENQYRDLKLVQQNEKFDIMPNIIYEEQIQHTQSQSITSSSGIKSQYNESLCQFLQKQLQNCLQNENPVKIIHTLKDSEQNKQMEQQSESQQKIEPTINNKIIKQQQPWKYEFIQEQLHYEPKEWLNSLQDEQLENISNLSTKKYK